MSKNIASAKPTSKKSNSILDSFSYVGVFFGSTACITFAFMCFGIAAMMTLGFSDFGDLMQAIVFTTISFVVMLLCLFVLYLKYVRKNKRAKQSSTRSGVTAQVGKETVSVQKQPHSSRGSITITTNRPSPKSKSKGKR